MALPASGRSLPAFSIGGFHAPPAVPCAPSRFALPAVPRVSCNLLRLHSPGVYVDTRIPSVPGQPRDRTLRQRRHGSRAARTRG
eukprot:8131474-Alexandrium_andersonii.AAC.1